MTRSLRGRIQLSLVVALTAILFAPLFACDTLVPGFSVNVTETGFVEGESGQAIETEPYFPSRHFCAVNETPFRRSNWWYDYLEQGIRRLVYLGTQNVTSVLVEVTFRALNTSCTLQFGSENEIYNTTTAEPYENKTLTFKQPVDDSEGWLYVFRTLIRADRNLDNEVTIQSFRVWVSADSDLCPVSFSLERTDGESLRDYTRMLYLDAYDYRWHPIRLVLSGNHNFYPWYETDTVYLKPGDYSGYLEWYSEHVQDISLSVDVNSSVECSIRIPVARLNITCTQDVWGYDIVLDDDYVLRTGLERTTTRYVWPARTWEPWVDLSVYSVGYLVFPSSGLYHNRFSPNASVNYDVIVQLQQPRFGSTFVVLQYLLLAVFLGSLALASLVFALNGPHRRALVVTAVKRGLVPVVLFVISLLLPWSTGEFTLDYPWRRPPLAVSEFTFPGMGTRMLFSADSVFVTGFLSRESWVPMVFWSLTLLMIAALMIRNRIRSLAVLSVLAAIGYIGESQGASWLLAYTMSTSAGPGPLVALLAVLSAIAGLSVVGVTSWFRDRQRSLDGH